jgi:hypothetical protein
VGPAAHERIECSWGPEYGSAVSDGPDWNLEEGDAAGREGRTQCSAPIATGLRETADLVSDMHLGVANFLAFVIFG